LDTNNPIIRRKRHRKDPRIRLREGARTRSIKRGWGFKIDKFKDLKPIPKKCPILDIPLFIGDGNSTDNSPTLDRVGNQEFYYSKKDKYGRYKGNVQVISRKANQMKSNSSFEDVEKLYFSLDSVREKCYYYAVPKKQLEEDTELLGLITNKMKEKTENGKIKVFYSIHSTDYEQLYCYVLAKSSQVQ